MARTQRSSDAALELLSALTAAPGSFDFYQALRMLEAAYPDRPRLGESLRPAEDPVRLGQTPELSFAPQTISEVSRRAASPVPEIDVLFFGLFGPNGPMPLHLTEYVRDRARNHDDHTWVRFANLFHHRMISMFYRAWASAQPTASYDRFDDDRFGAYMSSLVGYGMPSLTRRDRLPDLARQHYAGWFSTAARSADGLQAIAEDFFQLPTEVEEFVGHWLELPVESRCRLGESEATGALGLTATIGSRVWDCQFKFRIIMGPMDLKQYQRLLPGGDSLRRLATLVRNYVGDEFDWDLNLILRADEVPELRLGGPQKLGWTTWLGTRQTSEPAADLYLEPTH